MRQIAVVAAVCVLAGCSTTGAQPLAAPYQASVDAYFKCGVDVVRPLATKNRTDSASDLALTAKSTCGAQREAVIQNILKYETYADVRAQQLDDTFQARMVAEVVKMRTGQ